MKRDADLHRDLLEALEWDPCIRQAEIGIAIKDGVVTLTGCVDSYAQKFAAQHAAARVRGVEAVVEQIRVRLPNENECTDTALAHMIVDALRREIQVPEERVTAMVANGWITLGGEVEWQYQRTAAERAVVGFAGVKGITNLISVKPQSVATYDISHWIRNSPRRRLERDARQMASDACERGWVTHMGTMRFSANGSGETRSAGANGTEKLIM